MQMYLFYGNLPNFTLYIQQQLTFINKKQADYQLFLC